MVYLPNRAFRSASMAPTAALSARLQRASAVLWRRHRRMALRAASAARVSMGARLTPPGLRVKG